MSVRRQLPVYSPLPAGALLLGGAALLGGARASRLRILEWIGQEFGARDTLLTDSGTSAMALAFRAANRVTGRAAVALPAYGCYDLVTAALAAGVAVYWYDVDPATLGPVWPSLESAITGDVAAVVAVHLYGLPVDLPRVRRLAEAAGSLLVEDAAQGTGGNLEGRALGGWGDLGVLSFGRGKGITAGGGGALLANTPAGLEALGGVRDIGPQAGGARHLVMAFGQWLLARPTLYAIPSSVPFLQLGETIFRPPHPASPLSRAAQGILSATLEQAQSEAAIRRSNAERLGLRFSPDIRVPRAEQGLSGFLRLPALAPASLRGLIDSPGTRALGVMPGYPRLLSELPGLPPSDQKLSGAEELVRTLFTLPVHSRLAERDLRAVEEWIDEFTV